VPQRSLPPSGGGTGRGVLSGTALNCIGPHIWSCSEDGARTRFSTTKLPSCVHRFSIQLSRHSKWHNSTSAALRGTIRKRETLARHISSRQKMENGMLLDLRMRGGSRDRRLFISRATLLTLIILMTTVSCSRPDMPQPRVEIVEPDLFSGLVTEAPKRQLVQGDEAHPKIRREQPKTSESRKVATSRKVVTVRAPNSTSQSVPGRASIKANTPSRLDAQREEQLFQEFLEWQRRRRDLP
jgi:hypothetical protein